MSAIVDPHNTVKRAIDRRAARVPRRRRRVYTAAAYETAQVESGFRDLPGGDADSYGFRQQRESIYGRQNLTKQVDNLFRELSSVDRGQPSYELAAEVQRPAAQYRDRYRQAQPNALKLLGSGVPGRSSSAVPASSSAVPATRSRTSTVTTTDQAGYDQAVRRQRLATLLQHAGRGGSVLFKSGLLSSRPVDVADFQQTSTKTTTVPQASGTRPGGTPSSAPSSSDVHAALTAAKKRLGVHEDNGTNRSPAVDQLEKGFGMVAQPWCGIFVGTALREAGVHVDSRVASVAEIETMARNHDGAFAGGFHSAAHARAGDALITRRGQHVALVTHVDPDGTIHTIGGNQADGRVTRGAWKPDQVYGVARPHYRHR